LPDRFCLHLKIETEVLEGELNLPEPALSRNFSEGFWVLSQHLRNQREFVSLSNRERQLQTVVESQPRRANCQDSIASAAYWENISPM
jgi:hypothetical protein